MNKRNSPRAKLGLAQLRCAKIGVALRVALLTLVVHNASAQQTANEPTLEQLQGRYYLTSTAGDWADAADIAQQAYQLGKQTYSAADAKLGELAASLGHAQLQLGQANSIDALTQALGITSQALGDESEKLIPILMDFGSAQVLNGKVDDSEDTFDRAFELAEDTFGRGSTMLAKMNAQAGASYFEKGEHRLASSYLYDAHEIYEKMFGMFSSKTGDAAYRVAKLREALGNYPGMALSLKATIATFPDPTTPANDYERQVHQDLVVAYHLSDKPEKATPHVLALALTDQTPTSEPVLVVKPSPSYRGSKLDGTLTVRYDVDSEGFVRNTELVDSEGNRKLVTAAMDAIEGYRYIPVKKNGQTASSSGLETKIIFKWDDA